MPQWAITGLVSLGVAVALFIINKLTTKSAAQIARDIEQLKRDGWTTEQKIALERRFTILEGIADTLKKEVDFTKSSHQEFLRLLEKALIPVAHSPHTPELDELLEKRERGELLKAAEWQRLIDLLGQHAKEHDKDPAKQISLLSLRAIYMTHLRMAQKREEAERARQQFTMRSDDVGKTSSEIRGLRKD